MTTKPQTLDEIPGGAVQTYSGWVWVTPGGIEHRWSRDRSRAACEALVLEVCQICGIGVALDLEPEPAADSAPDDAGLALAQHVLALAGDPYLEGHPEWECIVEDARRVVAAANGYA